ncbi:MarR family transcriptional regulator [Tersicoccus sp. MR15.9]|uniref:MarR family winged helix-turn-helix transcriptional regulator n=1 Tax=Tersicoccus mangrovi TaxID=3121635 RepID=UPI002FE635B7
MTVTEGTAAALVEQIMRLQRIIKHVTAHQSPSAEGVGMAHVGILYMLCSASERRATDLADDLGIGTSALSRQISALEERGLLSRRPDPADGRASLLSVTDAGRGLVGAVNAERTQRLKDLLTGWDEAEAETATRTLGRLSEVFQIAQHENVRPRHDGDPGEAPASAPEAAIKIA